MARRPQIMPNNTSGHMGVSWNSQAKRWQAYIYINGKKKYLGNFQNLDDAVKRRLEAEAGEPCRPVLVQPDDPIIRLIALTKGQCAIVDASRYAWASQWVWYAQRTHSDTYYAARAGRPGEPKMVLLHRQILGEPDSQVDHSNGDSLECRMQNLRACTVCQNIANRGPHKNNKSGHLGISRHKTRWRAQITFNGQEIHLGYFATKDEAIAAREAGELKYFGEFAYSARPNIKKPPVSDDGAAYESTMLGS